MSFWTTGPALKFLEYCLIFVLAKRVARAAGLILAYKTYNCSLYSASFRGIDHGFLYLKMCTFLKRYTRRISKVVGIYVYTKARLMSETGYKGRHNYLFLEKSRPVPFLDTRTSQQTRTFHCHYCTPWHCPLGIKHFIFYRKQGTKRNLRWYLEVKHQTARKIQAVVNCWWSSARPTVIRKTNWKLTNNTHRVFSAAHLALSYQVSSPPASLHVRGLVTSHVHKVFGHLATVRTLDLQDQIWRDRLFM